MSWGKHALRFRGGVWMQLVKSIKRMGSKSVALFHSLPRPPWLVRTSLCFPTLPLRLSFLAAQGAFCNLRKKGKLWKQNRVLFLGIYNVDRNILQRNVTLLFFFGSWHGFFSASVSEKWARETPDSSNGSSNVASKPTIRFYCTNRDTSLNSSPLKGKQREGNTPPTCFEAFTL